MLCNDCQNLDWDKKRMNYWTKVCDCHILVEIQQQEANRSDIQPSEKFNSERIDIESTKKSTLPPELGSIRDRVHHSGMLLYLHLI